MAQRTLASVTVRVAESTAPPTGVNVVTSVRVPPLAARRLAFDMSHAIVTVPARLASTAPRHAFGCAEPPRGVSVPTTVALPRPDALKVTLTPTAVGLTLLRTSVARLAGAAVAVVAAGADEPDGAAGLGTVIAAEADEALLVPMPFVAVTVQVYVAPAVRFATVIGEEVPVPAASAPPVLLVQLASYARIAEPLAFAAVNDTLVLVVPSAGVDAVTADGASGADAMP